MLGCKIGFSRGFTCRFCGFKIDKNIIQTDIVSLLGTPSDEKLYIRTYSQSSNDEKAVYENKYGLKRKCPFVSLENVSIWNIAPPDVLHDLAEGCVATLFCRFIFKNSLNLKPKETIAKVEKFNFYYGKFKMGFEKQVFKFRKAKAVQVI